MKIERSALVMHSAVEMYQLVEDVRSYPQFLSWCTAATVYEQAGKHQKAGLSVSIAGIKQQFTTLNTLCEGKSVEMRLLEGPFKNLQGMWCFKQLGDTGCKISLKLDFELAADLLSTLFGKGFALVADRLVEDFCKRAVEVYDEK